MLKNLGGFVGQAKAAAEAAKISATEYSAQALQTAAAYIPTSETCTACGATVSAARNLTKIETILICVCCGGKFCKKCVRQSFEAVPDHLWSSTVVKSQDSMGLICRVNCYPECVKYWMAMMISKYEKIISELVRQHLQHELQSSNMHAKPTLILDSKSRKAKRLFYLAEYAAEVVGLDHYFKVLKIALMGSGALSMILKGDTAKLLYPLMECLKQFGVEGPTGLIRVYYLGCNYQLQRILNMNLESIGHMHGDPGVISVTCPPHILDYAGKYSGPAQWLYSALLPQPHDDEDWKRWYLSRIVSRQGWRLLFSMVESTILPNGVSCPAFALVCREDEKDKQALLVIRGTQTSIDWTINLDETLYSFTYRSGPKGERPVQGFVHTGMMLGVFQILDVYGMRASLHSLLDENYDVKIVGHSLGAGTSALLAADLRNGLYDRGIYSTTDIPRVCAIGYGCPPVVCETIADALLADDLMLTVIHRDDIVPRLCRFNLEILAREVRDIIPIADQWKLEDQAAFKRYAASYGVVGDMTTADEIGPTEQPQPQPALPSPPPQEEIEIESESESKIDLPDISISKEISSHIVQKQSIQFVVPGQIIHLILVNGFYHAVLCDHRLVSLRSITPLTHGIEDHKMPNHIKALRILRNHTHPIVASPPPPWQPFYDFNSNQWTKCYVCESELTWPYITRSDATRAVVSHHCRACGNVVCSICAPKGDTIPTEGVGKYQTLPDHSIALPTFGYVEPERVCMPCYLHSYHL